MATTITAGNATNGAAISSDNTGILELKSGTGSGTTAMTVSTGQNVTFAQAANLPNTFGFKNRIINGAMVIDQRNAGASVDTSNTAGVTYTIDRWVYRVLAASKFTIQRNAGGLTGTNLPPGFTNYLGCTSSSAYSVTSGDTFNVWQAIEGFNVADLGFGSANAQTVTLSFWVRSSLTGTFSGAFRNEAGNRSYVFTYTISAANTWEQKTVTIPGDTSGTWATGNGIGLHVQFSLGVGSTFSTTAGSWQAGNFFGLSTAVNVVSTNGATFYITGVQLEKGSTATSFDVRPYTTELQLCQRYAIVYGRDQVYNQIGGTGFAFNTTLADIPVSLPVQMRSTPTIVSTGNLQLSDAQTATAMTAIAITTTQSSPLIASLRATVASGLTAFRPYRIESANSTTPNVLISAEL